MVKKNIRKALGSLVEPKLNAFKFGLAGGIISAITILFVIIWSIKVGAMQTHMTMINEMYGAFGYSPSFGGAIIGAIYGFLDGFIITYIFAWIYNKLL